MARRIISVSGIGGGEPTLSADDKDILMWHREWWYGAGSLVRHIDGTYVALEGNTGVEPISDRGAAVWRKVAHIQIQVESK